MHSTLSIAVVATLFAAANARPTYPSRIPNGANVPDVAALGHVDPNGGGANNDFGLDFASAGEQWTTAFCQQDSDGDGQTNGQELGDPCCQWVQGSNAEVQWTEGVSHPGDASSTSDESLWANISCDSATSNSTNTTSSGTTEAGATDAPTTSSGSNTEAGSTTSAPTPTSGDATSSSSSSGSKLTPVVYSAAGILMVATLFL